jgi:hypothetical protein
MGHQILPSAQKQKMKRHSNPPLNTQHGDAFGSSFTKLKHLRYKRNSEQQCTKIILEGIKFVLVLVLNF